MAALAKETLHFQQFQEKTSSMIVLESDKLNRRCTLNVWQVRNTEIFCMGILLKQIFVTVSSGKVCSLY